MTNSSKRTCKLSFDALDLPSFLLAALDQAGYQAPTPIQAGLFPMVMDDLDVIGQAQTGTGKTAAFTLPLIRITAGRPANKGPLVLVVVPTRELALQVTAEVEKLSYKSDVTSVAVYGGKPIKQQSLRLQKNPHIVVGTPGRIIDMIKRQSLRTHQLETVVLDEADRMLDIGFRPDIEWILRQCPESRQTLLLSATVPEEILQLAKRYMHQPKLVNFSSNQISAESIDQFYFQVEEQLKTELLVALLKKEKPKQTIVFCRTKIRTEKIYRRLEKIMDGVQCIHGDLSQSLRNRTMQNFRDRKFKILVATDVMGRGIDVSGISHIINYDLPEISDDYVHRVGRTGRMGREGIAYSFISREQGKLLTDIEKRINQLLDRLPISDYLPDYVAPQKKPKTNNEKAVKRKHRRSIAL
ncbi:MAG: DEAD/DEAH box helicase [Planctomycetota bacterium]|nr:DEAD/DEAH box helicase [Planctomycetota bacterium]